LSDQNKSNNNDQVDEIKTVRKIVFIIISSIILIIIIGGLSSYLYISSALKPVDSKSEEKIDIEIPLESSSSDIAKILEEKGIIKDQRVFRFYVKFKNYAGFQAGEYTLSPSFTLKTIVEELQSGKIMDEPLHTVTIPEGKTVEQISEIFARKFDFSEEDFMDIANDDTYIEQLIDQYPHTLSEDILDPAIEIPLEGYLFPITYDFYEEAPSIEFIIEALIEQTDSILNKYEEDIDDHPLSVHDILTLASIVERESKFSEDRPKVAQVYMNRLDKNMKLQSDITAFYRIDHKAVVTYDDIEIDTPYNTYVIEGLPVGPIAAPSVESIEGVIMPEGEEFTNLYYFSRPNGETFYSDSLEEHGKIKEEYRQEWYDLEKGNEDEDSKEESEEDWSYKEVIMSWQNLNNICWTI